MGQMKWIYSMLQNGTYGMFKEMYKTAKENNLEYFIWAGRKLDVHFAYFICEYVDKHLKYVYDEHIDSLSQEYKNKDNYA